MNKKLRDMVWKYYEYKEKVYCVIYITKTKGRLTGRWYDSITYVKSGSEWNLHMGGIELLNRDAKDFVKKFKEIDHE